MRTFFFSLAGVAFLPWAGGEQRENIRKSQKNFSREFFGTNLDDRVRKIVLGVTAAVVEGVAGDDGAVTYSPEGGVAGVDGARACTGVEGVATGALA